MTIKGARVAILVEDEFEDSEVVEPIKALRSAGATITMVGSGSKNVYTGHKGRTTVHADTSADKVRSRDFDAVIVPGGHAPDKMRLHPSMVDFIRDAHSAGRIIAAVCHGPQLLISAGVIKGRTLTCWPSIRVDVKNAGANYVDQPVVRDGNLITSRGPEDLPQFSKAIIDTLEETKAGPTQSRTMREV